MQSEIVTAITHRRRITLHYPPGLRVVEPHVIGLGSDGQILLRAYQTEGASASGEHENWKLFRLDRIQTLSVGVDKFEGPRPLYNPKDIQMKRGIICRL